MTSEKYVKAIIKKVKCGREKRREIRQQLLSDISIALEQGETLEEIIGEMGSVQEVADEFNDNLSEAEHKKYSRDRFIKIAGIAAVILILVIAAIGWFLPKPAEVGKSGVFQPSVVEEEIKAVVQELNAQDYEALQARGTEAMKPYLTAQIMEAAKQQIAADWGECRSFGTVYMAEVSQMGKHSVVGEVTVTYENVSATFRISFDEDMKLAGLYMR